MYELLRQFKDSFEGQIYRHRASTTGDKIASFLYEDLLTLNQSPPYSTRAASGTGVVNTGNQIQGKRGRRGDGTFGRLVPGEKPKAVAPFNVSRGRIATLEIGTEVKILATAMIKQIDRVLNDLEKQAQVFEKQPRRNPRGDYRRQSRSDILRLRRRPNLRC